MEGSIKPGSRVEGYQRVKRSSQWNDGVGLLARSCKSATAWAGMRSERFRTYGTFENVKSKRF